MVVRGWGGEEHGVAANGRRASFWDEEDALERVFVHVVNVLTCHWTVRFYMICFMLHDLSCFFLNSLRVE